MKTYEVLAAELTRRGVSPLFGLMGEDLAKMIAVFTSRFGGRYLSSRHENAAITMADGYSRVAGSVGVGVISRGPGLTNALTALVAAARGRGQVLALVGDVFSTGVATDLKEIEQGATLSALGVPYFRVSQPADTLDQFDRAWRRAAAGGVAVLGIPIDILDSECLAAAPPSDVPPPVPAPSDADVARVAAILEASERPLVLAGRGAWRDGARSALYAVGDRIGAVYGTSLLGKGFFQGHPRNLGVLGGFAAPVSREIAAMADCVLAFGASLNAATTRGGTAFPNATIVRFDIDAAPPASVPVAELIVADAVAGAEALARHLTHRGLNRPTWRTPRIEAMLGEERWSSVGDESGSHGIDGRQLAIHLNRLLPTERNIVVDGGHCGGFAAQYLETPAPAAFVYTQDYSSIGLAFGAAIGAAEAAPDRLTVLSIGDGAFMMTLGELDSAVRNGRRMVVVVMNDSAYGAELHLLRAAGLPDETSLFAMPDIAATARGLGAEAATIRSLDDLDGLKTMLATLDRPLVLDCHINPNVMADWLGEVRLLGLSATPVVAGDTA